MFVFVCMGVCVWCRVSYMIISPIVSFIFEKCACVIVSALLTHHGHELDGSTEGGDAQRLTYLHSRPQEEERVSVWDIHFK